MLEAQPVPACRLCRSRAVPRIRAGRLRRCAADRTEPLHQPTLLDMAWNQPGEDKKRPPPRGAPDNSSLDELLRQLAAPGCSGCGDRAAVGGTAAAVAAAAAGRSLAGQRLSTRSSRPSAAWCSASAATGAVEQPGYGWHWPWPIETVTKVNVASVNSSDSKALMLTSDLSLIDISWSVQYRIADPVQKLFQVRDPEPTLRAGQRERDPRDRRPQHASMTLLSGEARAEHHAAQHGAHPASARLLRRRHHRHHRQPDGRAGARRGAWPRSATPTRPADDGSAPSPSQAYANDIVPKAQSRRAAQQRTRRPTPRRRGATPKARRRASRSSGAPTRRRPEVTRSRLYIDTIEEHSGARPQGPHRRARGGGNMIYLPLDKLAEAVRAASAAAAAAGSQSATPAAAQATGASRRRRRVGGADERRRPRAARSADAARCSWRCRRCCWRWCCCGVRCSWSTRPSRAAAPLRRLQSAPTTARALHLKSPLDEVTRSIDAS